MISITIIMMTSGILKMQRIIGRNITKEKKP